MTSIACTLNTLPASAPPGILALRPWHRHVPLTEREWLFYSFLIILIGGHAAFALVSWGLHFRQGLLASVLGLVSMLALGGLRLRGLRLGPLVAALQVLTLAQAFWITWLTGGIYSATIGWLALAPLPAVLARTQRARIAGLATGWALILGLYVYALMGGEMALQILPQDLIHWHLMMAAVIFGMQVAVLLRLNQVRNERLQRTQKQRRQLRQLTHQLRHSQHQKNLFVASVSHELRTPMNAILGLADLIHHDPRLDGEVKAKVQEIQKSGEHLLTIINDLMDHAQMEAGRLQVVREPCNLHETVKTGFQMLQRRAETKPVRYTMHIEPDVPPWILGDSHRLTQILVNLIGNAIKFTPHGEIELRCSLAPAPTDSAGASLIVLSVRDTGIGIAPELQHRVFQRFSQADSTIARRFGGNGLGLSITKGLVEAMAGTIDFESRPGVGTRFEVKLPCTPCSSPARTLPVDEDEDSEEVIRILIADDNPLNRQIASLQLRRHLPRAQVTEVDNGLKAFEAVRDGGGFDVILMDLLMPEMDGHAAARKIRNELPEPGCATPIIALTANADKEELERCLASGMNEYMLKPFNRTMLVKRVLAYVA